MDLEELKSKFRQYKKEDIIITDHAEIQAYVRGVDIEEVKNNIINPNRLVYTKEQESKNLMKRNMIVILLIQKSFAIDTY